MGPYAEPPKRKTEDELLSGYRGGIITAITLFISLSLLFVKYWSLEAVGDLVIGLIFTVVASTIPAN